MQNEGNPTAEQSPAGPTVEAAVMADTQREPVPESAGEADAREGVAKHPTVEDLKPGMRLKGKVRNVVEFGAFVDIGVGRDGLVHISSLKRAGVDQTVKVGDVIEVSVRRIDADENRISLTIPLAEDSKTSLRDLRPNSVVTGRVIRLVDFGAFVDIGAQSDGLLHVSQMAGGYVSHPSQVLKVGDEIQVRISEVDPRKRRISLTMRELDVKEGQEPSSSEETKPEERVPTAFEVAFERARVSSRRRRPRRP